MPTSNGQVGRYDIRREAVHTDHIVDEAVVTAKIPDLAVTFPDKIDDPVWSTTFQGRAFTNESLDTTFQTFTDITFDVPSWVDNVSVFAMGRFQITNTSGSDYTVYPGIEIEGEVRGGVSQFVPNNSTQSMMMSRVDDLIGVAGSTLAVTMEVALSAGSNSANFGIINGIVVGTR